MVDESKDRKQLYNSLQPKSTSARSQPEVENRKQAEPEVKTSSPEMKLKISEKRKIKVEPFESESQNPLETSF